MNINIFNGYQSTVPAVIKFRQMVDIIRGDKQLAELTKRYRITHQREYKSQCYCFSVTCVFQGGKAKKDIIEVTGVGFSDFDQLLPSPCSPSTNVQPTPITQSIVPI